MDETFGSDTYSHDIYIETDIALHEHCNTCYLPTVCVPNAGCLMMDCPNRCGQRMHACKVEDHFQICAGQVTCCINHHYGCPQRLKRGRMGSHLKHCPASIVQCMREWNRRPISTIAKRHLRRSEGAVLSSSLGCQPICLPDTDVNDSVASGPPPHCKTIVSNDTALEELPLDLAYAYRDQGLVMRMMTTPKHIRAACLDQYNKHYPVVPILHDVSDSQLSVEMVDDDESSDDEADQKLPLPPTCRDCVLCRIDPSSQHLHVLGQYNYDDEEDLTTVKKKKWKQPSSLPLLYAKKKLLLSLAPEFMSHHQVKKKGIFSITCAMTVRRDEFECHARDYHSDIAAHTSDWITQRCPFHADGCEVQVQRLYPNNGTESLIWNNVLRSYSLRCSNETKQITDQCFSSSKASAILSSSAHKARAAYGNLLDLPFDTLLDICSYLDSGSLYVLCLTSRHLRNIAAALLGSHGMVERSWIRVVDAEGSDSGASSGPMDAQAKRFRWMESEPVWRYSRVPAEINSWVHGSDHFSMSSHIQKCAYYKPVIYGDEPVPVLPNPVTKTFDQSGVPPEWWRGRQAEE